MPRKKKPTAAAAAADAADSDPVISDSDHDEEEESVSGPDAAAGSAEAAAEENDDVNESEEDEDDDEILAAALETKIAAAAASATACIEAKMPPAATAAAAASAKAKSKPGRTKKVAKKKKPPPAKAKAKPKPKPKAKAAAKFKASEAQQQPRGSPGARRTKPRNESQTAAKARCQEARSSGLALLAPLALDAREAALRAAGRRTLRDPEDDHYISPLNCLVRSQIEIFRASEDHPKAQFVAQVGLRCVNCATACEYAAAPPTGAQAQARAAAGAEKFPQCRDNLGAAIRNWHRTHVVHCPHRPADVVPVYDALRALQVRAGNKGINYYARAHARLDLVDVTDATTGISGMALEAGSEQEQFLATSAGMAQTRGRAGRRSGGGAAAMPPLPPADGSGGEEVAKDARKDGEEALAKVLVRMRSPSTSVAAAAVAAVAGNVPTSTGGANPSDRGRASPSADGEEEPPLPPVDSSDDEQDPRKTQMERRAGSDDEEEPPPPPVDSSDDETSKDGKASKPVDSSANATAASAHVITTSADIYEAPTKASKASKKNVGRWTAEEHRLFLQGQEQYGKDWKKIAQLIKTRTLAQICVHSEKVEDSRLVAEFLAAEKLAEEKAAAGEAVRRTEEEHRPPPKKLRKRVPLNADDFSSSSSEDSGDDDTSRFGDDAIGGAMNVTWLFSKGRSIGDRVYASGPVNNMFYWGYVIDQVEPAPENGTTAKKYSVLFEGGAVQELTKDRICTEIAYFDHIGKHMGTNPPPPRRDEAFVKILKQHLPGQVLQQIQQRCRCLDSAHR